MKAKSDGFKENLAQNKYQYSMILLALGVTFLLGIFITPDFPWYFSYIISFILMVPFFLFVIRDARKPEARALILKNIGIRGIVVSGILIGLFLVFVFAIWPTLGDFQEFGLLNWIVFGYLFSSLIAVLTLVLMSKYIWKKSESEQAYSGAPAKSRYADGNVLEYEELGEMAAFQAITLSIGGFIAGGFLIYILWLLFEQWDIILVHVFVILLVLEALTIGYIVRDIGIFIGSEMVISELRLSTKSKDSANLPQHLAWASKWAWLPILAGGIVCIASTAWALYWYAISMQYAGAGMAACYAYDEPYRSICLSSYAGSGASSLIYMIPSILWLVFGILSIGIALYVKTRLSPLIAEGKGPEVFTKLLVLSIITCLTIGGLLLAYCTYLVYTTMPKKKAEKKTTTKSSDQVLVHGVFLPISFIIVAVVWVVIVWCVIYSYVWWWLIFFGVICFFLPYYAYNHPHEATREESPTKAKDASISRRTLNIIEIIIAAALIAAGLYVFLITDVSQALTLALSIIGVGVGAFFLVHGIYGLTSKAVSVNLQGTDGSSIGTFRAQKIPVKTANETSYILKLDKK